MSGPICATREKLLSIKGPHKPCQVGCSSKYIALSAGPKGNKALQPLFGKAASVLRELSLPSLDNQMHSRREVSCTDLDGEKVAKPSTEEGDDEQGRGRARGGKAGREGGQGVTRGMGRGEGQQEHRTVRSSTTDQRKRRHSAPTTTQRPGVKNGIMPAKQERREQAKGTSNNTKGKANKKTTEKQPQEKLAKSKAYQTPICPSTPLIFASYSLHFSSLLSF